MGKSAGIYFLVAVAILMLVILITMAGAPYLEVKLLPMIIAGLVLALTLVQLVKEIHLKSAEAGHMSEGVGDSLHRYLLEGAWMVVFFLAIYILGFFVAMPLYILFYLRWHGRPRMTAIIMAVVVTGLSYIMFTALLDIRYYPGLVLEVLGF